MLCSALVSFRQVVRQFLSLLKKENFPHFLFLWEMLVELRLLPLLQLSLGTIPSMGAGPGILSRHPLVPGESSGESAAAVRAAEARHRGISQPFFPWRNGPEAKSCEAVEAVRSLKSQADFSSPAPFP